MLGRLAEIREAAGADVEVEKPPEELKKQEPDVEHEEYIAEMKDLYKEILEDEGAAAQAFEEVRHRVENMEEIVQLERVALLPTKLKQLANRFESQELVCQRMIRRAKELLTHLRAEDQDYDEHDDKVHIALRPVRNSIAQVRSREFKELVQGFFGARSKNRQEMIIRATRQLRFAYPDALEEELSDIMEFPELAAVAIAQRLEKGSEGVTLDGILAEMEGKKADAKKLEQGAKELKLMFLQFAELIDNQGESLNAIEANIKTVIEETSEAIGVLIEAEDEKRAYERKKMKFYVIIAILVFYFIIWPFAQDSRHKEPSDWGVTVFFTGLYHNALKKVAPEHYMKWHGDDGTGKPKDGGEKEHENGKEHHEEKKAAGGEEKKSSLLQATKSSQRLGRHRRQPQRLAEATLEVNDTRDEPSGYVPRHRRPSAFLTDSPMQRSAVLSNPIIRSVALTARGGAARHSSGNLRHQR